MLLAGFIAGISIGIGIAFAVNYSWVQECRRINREWYETCVEMIDMITDVVEEDMEENK